MTNKSLLEDSLDILIKYSSMLPDNFKVKPLSQEQMDDIRARNEKCRNNLKLLEFLGIPHFHGEISVNDLADIFRDEKKLHEIVVKMRNKAFW